MIQHIVLWKFLDEANGKTKAENLELVGQRLNDLTSVIPQIKSLSFVKNVNPTDRNSDGALITTFENLEDLDTYTIHPEHVKVAGLIATVVASRAAIDYTV